MIQSDECKVHENKVKALKKTNKIVDRGNYIHKTHRYVHIVEHVCLYMITL